MKSIPDKAKWAPGLEDLKVLLFEDFLPKVQRDNIFDSLCSNQSAFHARSGPNPEHSPSVFYSSKSNAIYGREDNPEMEVVTQTVVQQIGRLLPELFSTLNIASFAVAELPVSIVNGGDGHSANVHSDESGNRFKISLLYYLQNEPKLFSGGDIQFYESEPNGPTGYIEDAIAQVSFKDNLLIAFPSKVFHSITPVKMASNEFKDGRIAFISFIGNDAN